MYYTILDNMKGNHNGNLQIYKTAVKAFVYDKSVVNKMTLIENNYHYYRLITRIMEKIVYQ